MLCKLKSLIAVLLCAALLFAVLPAFPVTADDFEQQLSAFPARYHEALRSLHARYPNWTFQPDFLAVNFWDAVNEESVYPRKLVPASYSDSLKSMGKGAYNWVGEYYLQTSGSWVAAAKELIAYQMDPLNYLDYDYAYVFALQSYIGNETKEILIEHGIKNYTYLLPYADTIMEAGQQAGVNPYMLASTIIQEHGSGGSALIDGSMGCYNFFNIGATGSNRDQVIANGAARAQAEGWDTPEKAIIGGAKFYAANYIARGQNTYYYKNFNPSNYNHQYAQNVYDTRNSAYKLRGYYIGEPTAALTLRIPVYQNMPESAVPPAIENNLKNNYYFTSLSGATLSPAFDCYVQNYSLSVFGDTTLSGTFPAGASVVGEKQFVLSPGWNNVNLTLRAESGNTNIYSFSVLASAVCTLTFAESAAENPTVVVEPPYVPPAPTVLRGDATGDGKITVADLGAIKFHLLKKTVLSKDGFTAADVNGDGKITVADLGAVKFHLLGKTNLFA